MSSKSVIFSLLVGLLLVMQISASVGRQQSAGAKGKLMCKGRPAGGLNVKMYDHDTFTPDDKMAGVISSSDGTFNIAGHKSEIGTMRPDIKIYHKCGHLFQKCHKIRIPDNLVTVGSSPRNLLDVGVLNLENVKSNC